MKKYILISLLVLSFLFVGGVKVHASNLQQNEINAIISILRVFNIEESKVSKIQAILSTQEVCKGGDKYNALTGEPCSWQIEEELEQEPQNQESSQQEEEPETSQEPVHIPSKTAPRGQQPEDPNYYCHAYVVADQDGNKIVDEWKCEKKPSRNYGFPPPASA